MRQIEDSKTLDLLGGLPRRRGRPNSDKPASTAAERQAARRLRLKESGKSVLTVEVSVDVIDALDAFVRFKDVSKGDVVDRILRGTLLRKR